MLLRLALVGLLFLLSNTSRAQKNTLYLWVDTLYIDTAQTDVILDVKFKLDVQREPVKFYGYNAEIDYGPSAYARVVGNNGVILQNTGSRFISDPIVTVTDNQVKVVALGSEQAPIDTTYSTLFKIRLTAFYSTTGGGLPQGERALFNWDFIQLIDDSGIDSVVYGGGFVERRKTVPVIPDDTVRISVPAMTIGSDSTFDVPVIYEAKVTSKVQRFALSFDYDSSLVRLVDAYMAEDQTATLDTVITPTHGDVFVQAKDGEMLFGADTLFYLRFTSKSRTDTLCTSLKQVGFLPINDDAKVDAEVIEIGDICIQGKPEDPKGSVDVYEGLRDLRISPNPASELVVVELPAEKGRFEIAVYDVAGHLVHASKGIGRVEWQPAMAARGSYYVVVTLDGSSISRQVIVR